MKGVVRAAKTTPFVPQGVPPGRPTPMPVLALADVGRYPGERDNPEKADLETEDGMTQLLEQAMGEVQKLPDVGQDAIAAIILEEIADDRRWDDAFARSQDQLGRLANRVREDIRAGRTKNVGIDEL